MPKRPQIEQLLEHRDFLRALASQLVSDPGTQEDLVSDAMEAAVLRPPRHGALRPWLVRVLRSRAKNRQRDTARRQLRERKAAKAEGLPSAAEVAERFELSERLAEKVQQLPDPYREVVLFRYYENLAPGAIAESLGISVETVKTRLRRALEQLRHSLDRDHGSREKWLTALAPLTLPSLPTAGLGVAAGGTLLMSMKILAPLVLVPLLGLVAWFTLSGPSSETVKEDLLEPAVASAASISAVQLGEREADSRNVTHRSSTRQPIAAPADDPEDFIVRGRCVDSEGQALQGVKVRLRAWAKGAKELNLYELNHGEVAWSDPAPVLTQQSGRFTFRMPDAASPPTAYVVQLRIQARGFVPAAGYLRNSQEALVQDLGDLTLTRGGMLRGRVVDDKGRIRSGIKIRLTLAEKSPSHLMPIHPSSSITTESKVDGSFWINSPIMPGTWWINVGARLLSEPSFLMKSGGPETHIEIVVQNEADTDKIEGIVVDEQGDPIRSAVISSHDYSSDIKPILAKSKADGSFCILRGSRDRERAIYIGASKNGYETLLLKQAIPWRSSAHRLVMTKAKPLIIEARDARTNQPVESFSMTLSRTFPRPGIWYQPLHHTGQFPLGRATLEAVTKGRYRLVVYPRDGLLRSKPIFLDHGDKSVTRIRVPLYRSVSQDLEVIRVNGKPVPGTRIELIEAKLNRLAPGLSPGRSRGTTDESAMRSKANIWSQGTTNTRGRVRLTGPPDRELDLRILGPGHIALDVKGIRLKDNGKPIQVRVQGGATVRGRIRPPALLAQLNQLMGKVASLRGQATKGTMRHAAVRLYNANSKTWYPVRNTEGFELTEDGSFEIRDIAPGTWMLQLLWLRGYKNGGTISTETRYCSIKELTNLRADEIRNLDLRLPQLLFGTIKGQVLWNGRPLQGGRLELWAPRQRGQMGKVSRLQAYVYLDTKGKFEALLPAGNYLCMVTNLEDTSGIFFGYYSNGKLTVTAAGESQATVEIQTRDVQIRIHDVKGLPLPGVWIRFERAEPRTTRASRQSNDKGEIRIRASMAEYSLSVLPKGGQRTLDKMRKENSSGGQEARRKLQIPLGNIRIIPGTKPQVIDIEIPETAGYR